MTCTAVPGLRFAPSGLRTTNGYELPASEEAPNGRLLLQVRLAIELSAHPARIRVGQGTVASRTSSPRARSRGGSAIAVVPAARSRTQKARRRAVCVPAATVGTAIPATILNLLERPGIGIVQRQRLRKWRRCCWNSEWNSCHDNGCGQCLDWHSHVCSPPEFHSSFAAADREFIGFNDCGCAPFHFLFLLEMRFVARMEP
jgi:hypothetical protein